jgi:hypothetical protein
LEKGGASGSVRFVEDNVNKHGVKQVDDDEESNCNKELNPSFPDGPDDLFADFDSVEDFSEEEASKHGMHKCRNETKDDKDDVRNFWEGTNPNIKPLKAPNSVLDILLFKPLIKQGHNNRNFPGENIEQEDSGEVQVEHGDDKDEGGVDIGRDHEHGSGEVEVGLGVVLDEKEEGLDDCEDPGDEEELAFVLHGFEEDGEVGVFLLVVVEELLLALQLLVDVFGEL